MKSTTFMPGLRTATLVLAGVATMSMTTGATGALTPLAERTLCIDERDIQTGVDFDAERPHIDARIVCTIRIGQIVAVALIFGIGYLKQKLQAKKARAARAKTAPDTQERKVSNG